MKYIKTKRLWLFLSLTGHRDDDVIYLLPSIDLLRGESKEKSYVFAAHIVWWCWAITTGIIIFDKNYLPKRKAQ